MGVTRRLSGHASDEATGELVHSWRNTRGAITRLNAAGQQVLAPAGFLFFQVIVSGRSGYAAILLLPLVLVT